ncbi:thiamine diphosphokinase [Enterococcus timonensis]|uniref:thiamine diphosphokinase n=1 Tax=Enterococcus timonensis TaxID=1852364 RepID=UPI0008DACDDC|nr:thiamine diphosphokinase [Enterococcus timonensis]
MKVVLVAGHLEKDFAEQFLKKINPDDQLVGIDYGAYFLIEAGFKLALAVGDFDSLSASQLEKVKKETPEVILLPAEKDDTDTQAALVKALEKFPEATQYILLGAIGGRIDHFLANLYLPLESRFYPVMKKIQLQSSDNQINFFAPGQYTIEKNPEMTYLAYVALVPVVNLSLTKSRYTLDNQIVSQPFSFASNEFIGSTAEFSFDSGVIAVIQSRDQIKKDR